MDRVTLIVNSSNGISTSVASQIVQKANEFPCRISISRNQRTANAKSLLGVLALDIKCNDEVVLTADGEQESSALRALSSLLK